MVAGTFLAAPLMFVSARMLSVVVVSEMDYKDLLLKTSFDASIISMVACVSDQSDCLLHLMPASSVSDQADCL